MYDSLFSPSSLLSEQVARQIFELLPDGGPILAIIDTEGHLWPSDSDRFSELNISESFLKQLKAKIDDGSEPVVTQIEQGGIVASQLSTERTNCGYVMMILPGFSPEATMESIQLVEIILAQIGLIAKLIEKNSSLYELQMKHFSTYSGGNATSN